MGYETHGIVANGLISPKYGLDQGFEAYRFGWNMESAMTDAPKVSAFVQEHTTTPWLLFWHIMDPHLPYTTEASFREAFTDPDYDGRFKNRRGAYVPFEVLDPRPGRRWFVHEGPPPAPELTDADKRYVSDYYDAEIAEMDAAVGEVIEALKASGQWERTVVAFIADHGEGLNEHGEPTHSYFVYNSTMRVPLIIWAPDRLQGGKRVSALARTIDILPTALDILEVDPPADLDGSSLIPLIEKDEKPDMRSAYGESTRFAATFNLPTLRYLRRGDWKYIHKTNKQKKSLKPYRKARKIVKIK